LPEGVIPFESSEEMYAVFLLWAFQVPLGAEVVYMEGGGSGGATVEAHPQEEDVMTTALLLEYLANRPPLY